MFKLNEYLVKGYILSFKELSKGEGQITLESAKYYEKGILTDSDIQEIITQIEAIKLQWQKEAEEEKRRQEEMANTPTVLPEFPEEPFTPIVPPLENIEQQENI